MKYLLEIVLFIWHLTWIEYGYNHFGIAHFNVRWTFCLWDYIELENCKMQTIRNEFIWLIRMSDWHVIENLQIFRASSNFRLSCRCPFCNAIASFSWYVLVFCRAVKWYGMDSGAGILLVSLAILVSNFIVVYSLCHTLTNQQSNVHTFWGYAAIFNVPICQNRAQLLHAHTMPSWTLQTYTWILLSGLFKGRENVQKWIILTIDWFAPMPCTFIQRNKLFNSFSC